MSYAQIPLAEPDDGAQPPPENVVAAARSLFQSMQRRSPVSDAEALLFVKRTIEERAAAAAAIAAAGQSASRAMPPPGVLEAASNIFERHHGRKAETAEETMAFVHGIVATVKAAERGQTDIAASNPPAGVSTSSSEPEPGYGRGAGVAAVHDSSSTSSIDHASDSEVDSLRVGPSDDASWSTCCLACERSCLCRCLGFYCGITPCAIWRALMITRAKPKDEVRQELIERS